MPEWLWVLLGLPIVGVLAKIVYDRRESRRAEHRDLRREGAAAVTPVVDLIDALPPGAVVSGSQEQLLGYLNELRRQWIERRAVLMVYANAHPNDDIRTIAEELVEAVNESLGATTWLVNAQLSELSLDAFNAAKDRNDAARAVAQRLLAEIRA